MKKILVALDGSARAPAVLFAAVELAQLTRAKVILFRSFGLPAEMPRHVYELPEGNLEDALRRDAEAYLTACAKDVPRDLLAGIRVGLGAPWRAVCAAAQDERVDLIVVGSHGYGAIDHVIGTTAARVVNHADRSVLVVRA